MQREDEALSCAISTQHLPFYGSWIKHLQGVLCYVMSCFLTRCLLFFLPFPLFSCSSFCFPLRFLLFIIFLFLLLLVLVSFSFFSSSSLSVSKLSWYSFRSFHLFFFFNSYPTIRYHVLIVFFDPNLSSLTPHPGKPGRGTSPPPPPPPISPTYPTQDPCPSVAQTPHECISASLPIVPSLPKSQRLIIPFRPLRSKDVLDLHLRVLQVLESSINFYQVPENVPDIVSSFPLSCNWMPSLLFTLLLLGR